MFGIVGKKQHNSFLKTLKPVQSQIYPAAMISIFFKSSSSNVLTPSNVDKIVEITEAISNDTKYKNEFCLRDVNFTESDCAPEAVNTIIYEFVGLNQKQIDAKLDRLEPNQYHYFGQNIATSEKRSNLFVSYLQVGLPFPSCPSCKTSDYKSDRDRLEEQLKPYNEWMDTIWKDYKVEGNDLEVFPISAEFYGELIKESFAGSSILMFFCVLVILSYVILHTQSLFLGTLGMLQILICFAPAFVVYWYIMNIQVFGPMNMMIIFVILGIGADDMFVMTDAWVQSAHLYETDLERMSYAFKRAGKAMLITSCTTATAFFATTVSKLLPIKAFGVWAGWVILFNYLYFIVMYPCVIMIQHYYKNIRCCYFGLCCPCGCCKSESQELELGKDEEAGDVKDPTGDLEQEYRWMETFFKDSFSNVIVDYKFLILAVFILIAAVGIYSFTALKPVDEVERPFREGSKFDGYLQLFTNDVYADPFFSNIEIATIWGVKGIDRSNYGTWQAGGGDVVFDDEFDLTSSEAQQHIYDYCTSIEADPTLVLNQAGSTSCFMVDFKAYIGSEWPKDYSSEQDLVGDLNSFLQSPLGEGYGLVNAIGIKDDRLLYVEVTTRSLINDLTASSSEKKDNQDAHKAFLAEWNGKKVAGVANAKMTSVGEAWPIIETEPFFRIGAMQGIAIAVSIAFFVLLAFTQNILISIFAVVAIFGVMLSVSIFILAAGWKFGTTESVAVVIVIGFSVDYVVHLGHSYLESNLQDREKRLTMALLTMGISVTSGAITTALSGIPLMFSVFIFFYKMGLLIFFICIFALSWSLLFFMAFLAFLGPEGDTGNIQSLFGCKQSQTEGVSFTPEVKQGGKI